MLDFRNTNTLWASVLVETLVRLGAATAVISPGSRSTPLTIAFAQHPAIEAIPILDERSASFFALGRAQASGQCVVLVCTSGTAGAHYFPAIIEAYESQVPLLILTADRPPEMRDCASGQTIDQQKLFGRYPNRYAELAIPEATLPALGYLRQTIAHLWHGATTPVPGPVHGNCSFRDPLAPTEEGGAGGVRDRLAESFFAHLTPQTPPPAVPQGRLPEGAWGDRGLIIAGTRHSRGAERYCKAIAQLSLTLGWPILADSLSPLRNHAALNPYLISSYDAILRHPDTAQRLRPERVLQIGSLPTSKVLRQWLTETNPPRWVLDDLGRNRDPLHGAVVPLHQRLEDLVFEGWVMPAAPGAYCQEWCDRDAIAQATLTAAMTAIPETDLFESKLVWLLPQTLPPGTPVFIANSMPVRDGEWFWPPNRQGLQPFFNRGANGIDGTLSTALGIAHGNQSSVLVTGDLALLHDTNGFLSRPHFRGHLTVLLINNQGGGIFEMLPVSAFEPPFEQFFAMPQQVDFAPLCAAYGVAYQRIDSWTQLCSLLNPLPERGIRVLEIPTDRKRDMPRRMALLATMGSRKTGELGAVIN